MSSIREDAIGGFNTFLGDQLDEDGRRRGEVEAVVEDLEAVVEAADDGE